MQLFTGTITKDNAKYVLKISESTAYLIDDQDKASNYEGKQVRIAGKLGSRNEIMQVTAIECVS